MNDPNDVSRRDLTIFQTVIAGMVMGFIAYTMSFAAVPLFFTVTAILFGSKSLITIIVTGLSQLLAGYLHTHASQTGMSISTDLFGGFYTAGAQMKNRRQSTRESWRQGLKRFFCEHASNGLVLNFMWETFTICYLSQSYLFSNYVQFKKSINIEHQQQNMTMPSLTNQELEHHFLLVHGVTRYFAGCLSGIGTGIINHLWQRHLKLIEEPLADFNTDRDELHVNWQKRKKLLSPCNIENWIKAFTMFAGALFFIVSNILNSIGLHLLNIRTQKFISDILVIHGGWLFIRDSLMLLLMPPNETPQERPAEQPTEEEEMLSRTV